METRFTNVSVMRAIMFKKEIANSSDSNVLIKLFE